MNSLQVNDARLASDLAKYVEPVQVCDSRGNLLGLFVPAVPDYIKKKYAQLKALVEADKQRLLDRDLSRQTMPHAEVLVRLSALEMEIQRRSDAGEKPLTAEEAKAFVRGNEIHLT